MSEGKSRSSVSAAYTEDIEAPALATAAAKGRQKAEQFELGLRRSEAAEREELLALGLRQRGVRSGNSDDSRGQPAKMLLLQPPVDDLAAFHRAVLESHSWKVIQMLRRLLGRAW